MSPDATTRSPGRGPARPGRPAGRSRPEDAEPPRQRPPRRPVQPDADRAAAPAPAGPARPLRSADGRVVLDPRLRARRVEVRRDEGRRRLHRLAIAGAVAVLVLAAYGFVRSPLLAVHTIEVRPSPHLDAAALTTASGVRKGQAMVDVDQGAVVRRLEALPWVAGATVTRSWPGTITMAVTERRPAAQVEVADAFYLVDGTGRVLEQRAAPVEGLLTLQGLPATRPGATVSGAGDILTLAARIPASIRARVASIRKGGPAEGLVLVLTGGGEVHLGPVDELDDKLVSAVTMLDNVQPSCLGIIDVQVPAAPTLTPAPACA